MVRKKILMFYGLLLIFFVSFTVLAESTSIRLTLRSGKKVEGYLIEAESGSDCIKVSVQGAPRTYCSGQIRAIEMHYDKQDEYIRIDIEDVSQDSHGISMDELESKRISIPLIQFHPGE